MVLSLGSCHYNARWCRRRKNKEKGGENKEEEGKANGITTKK